jgi:hypothetical protein
MRSRFAMPTRPDHEGTRGAWAVAAVVALPAVCCGLPLLIGGGVLAGLGWLLGNLWVMGVAAALVVGLVAWRVRRRSGTSVLSAGDGGGTREPVSGADHTRRASPRYRSR